MLVDPASKNIGGAKLRALGLSIKGSRVAEDKNRKVIQGDPVFFLGQCLRVQKRLWDIGKSISG